MVAGNKKAAVSWKGIKDSFSRKVLGRPDLEIPAEVHSVEKFLKKKLPDTELPEPRAVLVFTHDRAALEVNDAPVPTVPASKLKETVRKAGKEKSITPDKVKAIQDALELL